MSYTTKPNPSLAQLTNVVIDDPSNGDILSYNNGLWENKSDFVTDEIDCRVLRVSETADIGGRLACVGVASFVNDEFIFQNGVSDLGDTLYIDNVNNRVGINKAVPEEDLDVDGNIQLAGANDVKINFYDSTGDYSHGKLVMNDDSTGSEFQIHTREVGSAVTQKFTINKIGAIGLGQTPSFGTTGAILTSNGESFLPTWNAPYYFNATKPSANVFRVTNTNDTIVAIKPNTSLTGLQGDWVADTWSTDVNDFNATEGEWTCPKTGIYHISFRAAFNTDPGSTDTMERVKMYLYNNSTSIAQALYLDTYGSSSTSDRITAVSLQISGLFNITLNDVIQGRCEKRTSGSSNQLKVGGSSGVDPQFSIYRVA